MWVVLGAPGRDAPTVLAVDTATDVECVRTALALRLTLSRLVFLLGSADEDFVRPHLQRAPPPISPFLDSSRSTLTSVYFFIFFSCDVHTDAKDRAVPTEEAG